MMRAVRHFVAFLLFFACATSANAQSYTYSVYIDADNSAVTGCTVSVPGGTLSGIESALAITVTAGAPPAVNSVTRSSCSGASLGAPVAEGTGAVSVGAGVGGATSIELSDALINLAGPSASALRLYVVAQSASGSDVLLNTTGAANGAPIILALQAPGSTVPTPLFGIPALLLLGVTLLALGSRAVRRRMIKRLMLGLVLLSGITSAAIFNWNGISPLATDPAGDSTSGESAIDLRYLLAASGGTNLYFRVDVTGNLAPTLPTVTAVSPSAGPLAGGTSVTITGTNFTGATAVKFGAAAATTFTVNTPAQITATVPAGSAGTVDVSVTTAIGTSATNAADHYTYTAAPTVTAVSPPGGPVAGGTIVTITGTNLTGATAVKFGAVAATTFTVNTPTQITATAPAAAGVGPVDVTVTTPGGTSAPNAADRYNYSGPPASIIAASGTPQSATVGTGFATPLVVTVRDASSNPVSGVTITFTAPASGASAVLSAPAVTNASGQTQVTATANNTSGAYSVNASVSGVVTPATFSLTNTATGATHFAVSAPATATAGTAFTFTVTALDQFNNTVAGYSGTVHFTSSDGQAVLPANSTLTNGVGTFSATLKTAGNQTLAATDTVTASITGTSNSIAVSALAATHFAVSTPATATAGTAFSFTVTAQDPFNNTVTGYAGTVHFAGSDPQAVLPANSTLTNGVGTFSATLKTAGNQTLTATDTVNAAITGTSGAITVSAAAATHYSVAAPASATPGGAFNFTVTAQDQFNNAVTGYAGTLHFTSSDAQAVLPADATLTNGVGTFSATLKTAGNQTLTATDTVTASITGTSNTVAVGVAAATHYLVSAPATATAGTAFNFTVTAQDQFNNTVTGYSGTVHFTSGDGQAVLPANATLTNGVGTFSATLKTAGNQTLTATDTVTASITGTSNTIAVGAAAAAHFAVSAPASATAGTAFNFTVTAQDPFNNTVTAYAGTIQFASSDAQAILPANATLTNGVGTFSATLKTAGSQALTATDTVTASITGASNTVAVSAAAATHYLVSAPATATAGAAFSFIVRAQDPFNNTATGYSGTVHFTGTDGAATLPANSTLTNGVGTFSATLKTAGNQTLTATDTVTASITGNSGTIAVSAAAATHYTVSAPATATAGTAFNVTVTALDQFNNTATAYAGTVHFTSGDAQAILPVNSTLTNGVGTFPATLKTGGNQTITATDTVTVSITGTSGVIFVQAPPQITSANSAIFTIGFANAFTITATGSPTVTNITKTGTATPAGVTFNYGGGANATLSSAANALNAAQVGTTNGILFTATNGILPDATQSFSLSIVCPAMTVSGILPNGQYGQLYDQFFTVSGGNGSAVTWSTSPSPVVSGLSIGSFNSSTGELTGHPSNTVANATVTITATDAYGCQASKTFNNFSVTPVANPETYNKVVGNTQFVITGTTTAPATPYVDGLSLGAGFSNLLANDQGPGPLSVSPSGSAVATANGGSVTIQADGSFIFTPKAGDTAASDTFTYTIKDGNNVVSTPATVTLTRNNRVWYVDGTAGAGGTGGSNSPFNSLASASIAHLAGASAATGDVILVKSGASPTATPGAITLKAFAALWGQGVALPTNGVTLPSLSIPIANTGAAATKPVLNGTVTLGGNGNILSSLDINTGAAAGLTNTGALTGVTVRNSAIANDNVTVTTTTGTAVGLSNVSGTLTFRSISAGAAPNGISLSGTSGTFTVTGDGTNARNGSGGVINGTSGAGVLLSSASGVSLRQMNITLANTAANGIDAALAPTTLTLNLMNVTGPGGTPSGPGNGIALSSIGSVQLTNSVISNAANDGLRLSQLSGTLAASTIYGNTFSGSTHDGVHVMTDGMGATAGAITNLAVGGAGAGQPNSFTNNNIGVSIEMATTSSSNGNVTFALSNNTFNNQFSHAINVSSNLANSSGGMVTGLISNNAIGTSGTKDSGSAIGDGMRVQIEGTMKGVFTISGNTLNEVPNAQAFELRSNSTVGVNFKLVNNLVPPPSGTNQSFCVTPGLACPFAGAWLDVTSAHQMCAIVKGNSIYDPATAFPASGIAGYELDNAATGTFNIEGTQVTASAEVTATNTGYPSGAPKVGVTGTVNVVAAGTCGAFP